MEVKECTKTKFANEEAAKHAIRQIAKKNPTGKRPTRAYECSLCGLWHLTSRPDIEVIYEENNHLKTQVANLKHEIYLMNYEKNLMTKQERNEVAKETKKENMYQQLRLANNALRERNKRIQKDNRELLQTIIKLQNEIEKLKNENNKNGEHPLSEVRA